MTRLSSDLTANQRHKLSTSLASVAVKAALGADLRVVIVSCDPEVRAWATVKGIDSIDDNGSGLSESVTAAVGTLGNDPWLVLHADLPLLTSNIIDSLAGEVATGESVVCPSLDGGTNIIGGSGPFEFSYGPGSFTRHLAELVGAKVVVSKALAIEVDTADHYAALSTLGYMPSLAT
jgi:2-phospho-L-lactate guanylyltransferase (CobY/MobA/RfbA family)